LTLRSEWRASRPAAGSIGIPPWLSAAYRPDIDGLRAISILAVLFFHAFPNDIASGFVGVDVFFVISGFLIGGMISAELEAGRFSFAAFYARRVRRIFPALIVVMAFVYAVGWNMMYPEEFRTLGRHLGGAAAFVSNIVLLNEVGYFDMEAHTKPLLHLWSLAIEEQFYLLWPLFAWLLRGRRSLFLALTVALWFVSFALNVAADSATAFYSPQTRFWELATGVLLAHLRPQAIDRLAFSRRLRQAAGVVGVLLIAFAATQIPTYQFPGWWALLPVLGAALVIASGPATLVGTRFLAAPPMVFVGKISYPLYLWHWPLFAFAWLAYGSVPPAAVAYPLIVASFVLAWLTYRLVEMPIRFGVRRGRAIAALVSLVAASGLGGLLTLEQGGLPMREVAIVNKSRAEDIRVPTDTRTSDGSCAQKYGVATGDAYVCFVNSPKPRLLFIGDSVSMAFYSAIKARRIGEDAALVAAHSFHWREPGCLGSEDFEAWLKLGATCQAVIRAALDILRREPSIEAVVLPTYSQNPFFADPARLEGLRDAVLRLGRKVVYATATPQFYRPPGGCWPRQFGFLGVDLSRQSDIDSCREARGYIEPNLLTQRNLFTEMTRNRPETALYDSLSVFCDARYCYQSDDKGALFWSWAHVNERGSLRVLRDFLPWVHRNVLKPE
jgi:peptidoglycan/LPS O-acetylase OafA/YrhL